MATVTIRNLPDEVVARIKRSAEGHGRSMEAEVRDLLNRRYRGREAILERIQERWENGPRVSVDQVEAWIDEGRP